MLKTDLNALKIFTDGDESVPSADFGTSFVGEAEIVVHFKNLRGKLVSAIAEADYVVGCVAWLTEKHILGALSFKKGVSIIVQKEDWLRPDLRCVAGWKADLQKRYAAIPGMGRWDCGLSSTVLNKMSRCGDPTIDAVRCMGNLGRGACPRMHHKFPVFCRGCESAPEERTWEEDNESFAPYAVWTGSFNTKLGTRPQSRQDCNGCVFDDFGHSEALA